MIYTKFVVFPFLCFYLFGRAMLVQPIYRNLRGIHIKAHDDRYHTANSIGMHSVSSLCDCLKVCLHDDRCLSYFHNSLTGDCILHSDPFTYTPMSNSGTGWKFYLAKPATGRCSEQADFFYYRHLDFCYNFNGLSHKNYTAFEENCRANGTTLLRIDSVERMQYHQIITTNVGVYGVGGICIQGYRGNIGDNWTFTDGTSMTYFNWGPLEPSGNGHIEIFRYSNYEWYVQPNTGNSNCSYSCELRSS